jgi:predicted dehydrogenase
MKMKVVVVGYGDRGSVYADYAVKCPDELEIVAVVDPDLYRLKLAKEKFGLKDSQLLTDFNELLKRGKIADGAIVATMDQLHYEQAKALLEQNYHLLLEKPVVNNAEQLEELRDMAVNRDRIMMVGHVLRYTPFYGSIKQDLLDGKVGQIMHIETSELVGVCHASCSYIRGKWKSEAECGSGMLLAKCCHDIDLICWLNNVTQPTEVVSYGGRNFITPNNAPKNSPKRCYDDCPHLETCRFSAKSLYVDNDLFPIYSYPNIKKPHEEITLDEKLNALKTDDPMGVCAYKTGSDLVDHQSVMMKFKNGSTAFHSMMSAVPRPGRKIHIIGTEGEIEGFFEENRYTYRKFDPKTSLYTEEYIDVLEKIEKGVNHGGGDIGLIRDFVKRLRGEKPSIAATDISDSVNGHECVYAAEESRTKGGCVKLDF